MQLPGNPRSTVGEGHQTALTCPACGVGDAALIRPLQGDQLHQELGARRQLGPGEVLDLYSQSLLPFQSQRPQAIKLRLEVLPPH